jgi:hypothetical protein
MDQHAAPWTCGGPWAVALRKAAGTIIEPKLGLHPKLFGEARFAFWMGGNFTKKDEPQGNQVSLPGKLVHSRGCEGHVGCHEGVGLANALLCQLHSR